MIAHSHQGPRPGLTHPVPNTEAEASQRLAACSAIHQHVTCSGKQCLKAPFLRSLPIPTSARFDTNNDTNICSGCTRTITHATTRKARKTEPFANYIAANSDERL
jgi:hypothetical protein